jgi:hypothetical protein
MIIDLKKEFPDVKIIAMSGGGLNKPDGYLEGAKKLGAARTLTRPTAVIIKKLSLAIYQQPHLVDFNPAHIFPFEDRD